jgi:hypothetical protein
VARRGGINDWSGIIEKGDLINKVIIVGETHFLIYCCSKGGHE